MRKRLEMSDLTPTDIAAHAHIEQHLKQGVWTSQTEMNAALRNPLYHMEGELGRLYRHEWEAKGTRTQQSGVSIIGDNKASSVYPAHSISAGAVRNDDGSLDVVGIISPDAPNGNPAATEDAPRDDSGGKYGEGVRVNNLPGGVTSVSIRSGSLPLIKQSPAEKKAREAYVTKAKARQQIGPMTLPLPLIDTKDKE